MIACKQEKVENKIETIEQENVERYETVDENEQLVDRRLCRKKNQYEHDHL
jgi:hypothetical protein